MLQEQAQTAARDVANACGPADLEATGAGAAIRRQLARQPHERTPFRANRRGALWRRNIVFGHETSSGSFAAGLPKIRTLRMECQTEERGVRETMIGFVYAPISSAMGVPSGKMGTGRPV